MTIINIQDDVCWKCGEVFIENDEELSKTIHHTIPKQLNPKKNITVPIHKKCHDEITSQDMASLTAYAYKLIRQTEQLNGAVEGLNNMLGKMAILKVKKHD
jgi:hypothetical protein